MQIPRIIHVNLVRDLVRRRLLVSLPLCGAIILTISALSSQTVHISGQTNAGSQHTTVLQTTRSQGSTTTPRGTVLSDNTATTSNTTSTTTTVNADGTTTVSGSVSGGSGDVPVDTTPVNDPVQSPVAPTDPCTSCPGDGSATVCPDYCTPPTPPVDRCNTCGSGTMLHPRIMCPMYACAY